MGAAVTGPGGTVQDGPVAARFAHAVARRDPQRLAALLDDAVRLRALLPGGVVEARGTDAAACLCALLEDFDAVEVTRSAAEAVVDRLLIHYRLRVSRGATRWDCTQTAVCTAVGGRLTTINLLCSGFREIHDDDADLPTPSGARLVG